MNRNLSLSSFYDARRSGTFTRKPCERCGQVRNLPKRVRVCPACKTARLTEEKLGMEER